MRPFLILASCLLIGGSGQTLAQDPNGPIDLDLLAAIPGSQLVVGRVAFTEAVAVCPLQFGTLRFSADGAADHLRALGFLSGPRSTQFAMTALDDETYRHRIATDTCRVDLDIGEQVRRDHVWTSLQLPRMRRPSLSSEERSEAESQYRDSHPDPVPLAQFGRYKDAGNARKIMGSGMGSLHEAIRFDGAPTCFDAVGDYLIDQRGMAFQFVTNLPGELNRFVLERVDIDDEHSRLYLTQGDCRFVLTIGSSVMIQDQWMPRSIAPLARAKARQPR